MFNKAGLNSYMNIFSIDEDCSVKTEYMQGISHIE